MNHSKRRNLFLFFLSISCGSDVERSPYPSLSDKAAENWMDFPFCNWGHGEGPSAPDGMYKHDICTCQPDAAEPSCDGRNVDWADEALVERYYEQPGCYEPPVEFHRACYWTPDQDGPDDGMGRCCYCARMIAECYPIPF